MDDNEIPETCYDLGELKINIKGPLYNKKLKEISKDEFIEWVTFGFGAYIHIINPLLLHKLDSLRKVGIKYYSSLEKNNLSEEDVPF